jgi:hypothetical protein
MQTEIKNGNLIITMPLGEPRLSSTGKSSIVASTGGFVKTDQKTNGRPLSVSVNAIIK